MILDSSAIVALFLREPGYESLAAVLAKADDIGVGGPTLVETSIVLQARRGDCLSYAAARVAGQPLLCIGEDFRQTDLPLVL